MTWDATSSKGRKSNVTAGLSFAPRGRPLAALLLAAVLFLDLRSLAIYFRNGRPDWRPLAEFLRRESPAAERVFTENQYSQLCVAFYLVGPTWLFDEGRHRCKVLNLDGEVVRLTWSWRPGEPAWLVLAGEPRHPELRRWAATFPSFPFPSAEGSDLRRLDPALGERAFAPGR